MISLKFGNESGTAPKERILRLPGGFLIDKIACWLLVADVNTMDDVPACLPSKRCLFVEIEPFREARHERC